MKEYRKQIYHFINGIRSNIPLCCTLFFCQRCIKSRAVGRDVFLERNPTLTANDFGKGEHVGYVRCDKCHSDNITAKVNSQNGTILKQLL